ncbi:MAG: ECF transporter S component [Clostridiales Family XIII bacterium]|jgi:energy-coupling factor transport system substrate-specific component|nr:ECF transporter S component [Clostridiales Family XIII bacterium]
MKTFLKIAEPVMLALVLVILIICAVLKFQNNALILAVIAFMSFVPFAVSFEKRRPKPAEIMPIVVLTAIAVVGRVIMTPIPNFQPVSALVVFTGIFFGRRSGYLMGAFTALISDMMLGMGPWLPWQMYGWGVMGYFAGVLADRGAFGKGRTWAVFLYGIASSAFYGLMLDTWFIIGFVSDITPVTAAAAYAAGIAMNISHIISTVVFLSLTYVPWGRKIRRIKIKYDMISN